MHAEPLLAEWEGFYVIVGAAAGALVGIQFVVIALLADLRQRATADSIHAFATPNVVHFGLVLVVSAIMTVPWESLAPASFALVPCGLVGLGLATRAARRAHRQTVYRPSWDDWLWYAILPAASYIALVVAALVLRTAPFRGELWIGAVSLGLMLLGIRNAWDTVTHLVVNSKNARADVDD